MPGWSTNVAGRRKGRISRGCADRGRDRADSERCGRRADDHPALQGSGADATPCVPRARDVLHRADRDAYGASLATLSTMAAPDSRFEPAAWRLQARRLPSHELGFRPRATSARPRRVSRRCDVLPVRPLARGLELHGVASRDLQVPDSPSGAIVFWDGAAAGRTRYFSGVRGGADGCSSTRGEWHRR